MLALTTGDLVIGPLLVIFVASILWLVGRLIWRLWTEDEVEVASRLGDQVTGGREEQTPEEAVAEWERKRRKKGVFRR